MAYGSFYQRQKSSHNRKAKQPTDSTLSTSKALPAPPSHIRAIRHNLVSVYSRCIQSQWHNGEGYHIWILCCVTISALVFLINLVSTVVAVSRINVVNGHGTLLEGDCKKTKSLDRWLHLLINISSTSLLGASNYCMQCLSSPTRKEVDKAHSKNTWLEIGVPNIPDVRHVPPFRFIMWLSLAIVALPLHLLYNSAVFSALSFQTFSVFVVDERFTHLESWSLNSSAFSPEDRVSASQRLQRLQQSVKSLQRLENKECIEAYAPSIVSSRGDVLLIAGSREDENNTNTVIVPTMSQGFEDFRGMNKWPCADGLGSSQWLQNGHCDMKQALSKAKDWQWLNTPITYCLSQRVEPHCETQINTTILTVVIICNLIELVCMSIMAWKADPDLLVTTGDAIASFLDEPDSRTKRSCLITKYQVFGWTRWHNLTGKYKPQCYRWFRAASGLRWAICTVLPISTLCLAAALLLSYPYFKGYNPRASIWDFGFGEVNPQTMFVINHRVNGAKENNGEVIADKVSFDNDVTSMVLLANTPQVILSVLYFGYNSLFTCMLQAKEWSEYAHQRKPLRVTSPTGNQRSTFWLQLPYRYGIPLLLLSGLLHWLVSQSIFLTRLTAYDYTGTRFPAKDVTTCGFSPVAILIVVIVGMVAMIACIATGFRRYKPGMPLVGSCSAAISAACHAPETDTKASIKRLKWGVVRERTLGSMSSGLEHCSFSSFEVHAPVRGELYA